MSMILGDETGGQPLFYLALGTAGSLILANLAGVFRRRAILGPNRLADDESAQVMLGIAGVGLLAFGFFEWVVRQAVGDPRKLPEPQQVALSGGTELAVLIALIVATIMARPEGLRRMGVGPSKLPPGIMYGFISILIVLPMMFWIEAGTEKLWEILHKPHPSAHDLLIILGKTESPWVRLAIVVIAVGVAPAAEEMFFRGCIQTFLRYALGHPWPAVLLTAVLFALAHDSWTWLPIFFLGICLGYLYERTGNLWANITLHALFNLSSILIYSHWAH